jgi:hypothetical protein
MTTNQGTVLLRLKKTVRMAVAELRMKCLFRFLRTRKYNEFIKRYCELLQ